MTVVVFYYVFIEVVLIVAGEEKTERLEEPNTGLYIHIPFCAKKCPYCDFNSVAGSDFPETRYVDALIRELDFYLAGTEFNRPLESLYIGGGTPSILSFQAIERIVAHIKGSFQWTPGIEATIEANPTSVDSVKLEGYLASGINRISLGIQSFNDAELKALGRTHSAAGALGAFNMAREAGFGNIGIDLIYAIPGQSTAAFKENLDKAVLLRPEHISIYGLTLEEGTVMKEALNKGDIEPVSDDEEADCYTLAGEILVAGGYTHYEISNFALQGYESRHNRRYWESRDYLGLGAGAHSCSEEVVNGEPGTKRRWNITDVENYMLSIEGRGSAMAGEERLTEDEERLEALYLGLRLLEGIDIDAFEARFKINPMELLTKGARESGFLTTDSSGLVKLTRKGLLFSDSLF